SGRLCFFRCGIWQGSDKIFRRKRSGSTVWLTAIDEAGNEDTLAQGQIFAHIGIDDVTNVTVEANTLGKPTMRREGEQHLGTGILKLVRDLLFIRERAAKHDDATRFESAIEGDDTLGDVG